MSTTIASTTLFLVSMFILCPESSNFISYHRNDNSEPANKSQPWAPLLSWWPDLGAGSILGDVVCIYYFDIEGVKHVVNQNKGKVAVILLAPSADLSAISGQIAFDRE